MQASYLEIGSNFKIRENYEVLEYISDFGVSKFRTSGKNDQYKGKERLVDDDELNTKGKTDLTLEMTSQMAFAYSKIAKIGMTRFGDVKKEGNSFKT